VPVALVVDRRARAEGSPRGRRAVAFVLALVCAPLGAGLWLGLLHRRSPRRSKPY
jgi:hypothetical protein